MRRVSDLILAVQVRELDDVARTDHVEALAHVRQASQLREVRRVSVCRPRNTWSSVSLRPIVTATNSEGRGARERLDREPLAAAAGRIVSSSSGLRSCAPTAVRIAPATTQEAMMPNLCGSAAAAAEAAAFAKKGRVTRGDSGRTEGGR